MDIDGYAIAGCCGRRRTEGNWGRLRRLWADCEAREWGER